MAAELVFGLWDLNTDDADESENHFPLLNPNIDTQAHARSWRDPSGHAE
jgi:hypothetical protein